MRFIKVTLKSNKIIYINPLMIGSLYVDNDNYTVIGHLTHNNGGYMVKESIEEVLKLIEDRQYE